MTDLFKLELKKSFNKDLRALPKHIILKVLPEIELLAENPFSQDAIKLKGTDNFFRIRFGDYRLVYQVFIDQKLIVICYLRHRRDVYSFL